MTSGIYQIVNTNNGKRYIGSSKDISDRLRRHQLKLEKEIHPNIHLQRSWNKHGEDAFLFMLLEKCTPETRLEREQMYLDLYQDTGRWRRLYNMAKVAANYGPKGEQAAFAKITNETARNIRLDHRNGVYVKELSESYKLPRHIVCNVLTGRSYEVAGGLIVKQVKRDPQESANAKFGKSDVVEIRKAYAEGNVTQTELSNIHGVSIATIHRIVTGKSWADVRGPVLNQDARIANSGPEKLSDEDVTKIRKKYLSDNITQTDLAEEYSVSQTHIGRIVNRKRRCG